MCNKSSHYYRGVTKFRTGNGAAWLDLLATLAGRYRDRQVDALDSPARLRAWLREHDLEPTGAVTDADLLHARTVREALHRIASAALRYEPPNPADVRQISQALRADRPVKLRQDRTRLRISRPATAAESLARLAREALQDLAGPRRAQLQPCGDHSCSGIFIDTTGRRRWCSDQTCGNRVRVRAYRSRAKQA
jgi:predicted RNA-binding Zn ribbon-like protein